MHVFLFPRTFTQTTKLEPPSPSGTMMSNHRSPDTMKDSILKESTAGWSNAITPLRIAKRESTQNDKSNSPQAPGKGMARRSSNSYKHVWTNNLVSKSPFKSQIPTPSRFTARNSPRGNSTSAAPTKSPRKVSGEKRPRPESLIHQAEVENAQRTRELGFKRRQSKGFQGLAEKEPVTKSPFRRIVSPTSETHNPISITLPHLDDDATSIDTDTASSRNKDKHDVFDSPPPPVPPKPTSPVRPFTPQNTLNVGRGSPAPSTPQHEPMNSSNFGRGSPMRVSPLPSALQASPTRSSLVYKRLMGPRSFSNSPSDTAQRKTVKFDERCNVLEFDRESHEDVTFSTDEEEVYGTLDEQEANDSSFDSSIDATVTGTRSQDQSAGIGDDSINGLVDSMLQEASVHSQEPVTPPANTINFSFEDLMNGGDEDGVPHGRMHHSQRSRLSYAVEHENEHPTDIQTTEEGSEPSFSSISLSTPPQNRPQSQTQRTPLLPPDTEQVEDGMPLGRSHRADHAREVRKEGLDVDEHVGRLPPSPSPAKRVLGGGPRALEATESIVPKFDLGIKTSSPFRELRLNHSSNEDPFGLPHKSEDAFTVELEFDMSILSNTSIASFHDFPPRSDYDVNAGSDERQNLSQEHSEQEMDLADASNFSSLEHSDPCCDNRAGPEPMTKVNDSATSSCIEVGRAGIEQIAKMSFDSATRSSFAESYPSTSTITASNAVSNVARIETPPLSFAVLGIRKSASSTSLSRAGSLTSTGSQGSIGSNGRSPRPRISREDIRRRALERGLESPIPSPSLPIVEAFSSPASSRNQSPFNPQVSQELERVPLDDVSPRPPRELNPRAARPPLEERLKRALSPPLLSSGSPLPSQLPSRALPMQPVAQPLPRPAVMQPRAQTFEFASRPAVFDFGQPGVEIGDMRSALDRLVQDVGGQSQVQKLSSGKGKGKYTPDASGDISIAETDVTEITDDAHGGSGMDVDAQIIVREEPSRKSVERANTAPILSLPSSFDPAFNTGSRVSSNSSIAPPVPSKEYTGNAIKEREALIKAKRREQRAAEEGEYVPPRRDSLGNLTQEDGISPKPVRLGLGRPSGRRSLSTGDADDLRSPQPGAQRRVSALKNQRGGVLGIPFEDAEDPFGDAINRELRKLGDPKDRTYNLREHEDTIYASSSQEETVTHMSDVGDIDSGKAWRPVRRPSDMNEYSRQIKEFRSQEKPGKAHGKVFVKVLGIKNLQVPLPNQPTAFTCTLNNGIHFVTTPESRLTRDSRIEQEFELIEHGKLEFTLTLKVRRDPHIMAQFKSISNPPPPPPQAIAPPASKGGMRGFFGGGSKKPKPAPRPATPPVVHTIEENLARYLKPDGTLARAFVSFKEIASRCDTRLFETSYQLIGQRLEGNGAGMTPRPVGEIVLQVFRLPPLPGVPHDQLPQSLEECHRGLRHINWHKVTYHEGTLTQLGGDCTTWRRRQLRVIGANLVAFNDITKKATATIDLKKAIGVEDDQEIAVPDARSPASAKSMRSIRDIDDFGGVYGVERSFRLIFPNDQEISFFADTDEEKARWLEVLRALVGRIPPNPLWAELIWQRQDEMSRGPQPRPNATPSSQGNQILRRQR